MRSQADIDAAEAQEALAAAQNCGGRASARRRGRCLGQDRSDRQGQRKGEKMTLQGGWQHVRFHTIKVSIRSIMNSVSS